MDYNWSIDRIALEIKKCEVRCANCHKRKTHKAINSYKAVYLALTKKG